MHKRTISILLTVILAMAALAGCGGNTATTGNTTSSAVAITKDRAGNDINVPSEVNAIVSMAPIEKGDAVISLDYQTAVFIKDMGDFPTVNAVYAAFFGDHKPARSCVEVARLPRDGLVEIEFVAVRQ